jgi:fused signal recognition particle receptor
MGFFTGWADRLKQGLERSRQAIGQGLDGLLALGRPVDEAMLEELEELLIASDLGAADAVDMVERVRAEAKRTGVLSSQDVRALLRRLLEEALAGSAAPLELVAKPSVMLMLGVNGAGKTTSTGKLAASLVAEGKNVLLAATDTFRAAERRWTSSARARAPTPRPSSSTRSRPPRPGASTCSSWTRPAVFTPSPI